MDLKRPENAPMAAMKSPTLNPKAGVMVTGQISSRFARKVQGCGAHRYARAIEYEGLSGGWYVGFMTERPRLRSTAELHLSPRRANRRQRLEFSRGLIHHLIVAQFCLIFLSGVGSGLKSSAGAAL